MSKKKPAQFKRFSDAMSKIVADILEISAWTVGTHIRRIFAKLGVNSRAAMVAKVGLGFRK